ncbi:oligosaccharide flippase family protein [Limibacillus halophilus]
MLAGIKARALGATGQAFWIPVVCELAALLRNLLLARLLGAEEMGKLMLLALALRLAEMVSDLSVERLMAQAADGGSFRLQRNLQTAALLRGLASAVLILLLALPLSATLAGGPAPSSFAWLCLIPLIRGGIHLDYRRFERNLRFRSALIVDGGSAVIALAAVPLAAAAVGDHRALLPIGLLQAGTALLLSHLVARRRYRLAADTAELLRAWRFGAPLLVNGLLIFAVFQGDRLVVAYGYDWADVGRYAIALQLALLPTQVLARTAQSLLLPRFRRAIAEGSQAGRSLAEHPLAKHSLAERFAQSRRGFLLLGLLFLLGYGLLADPFLGLLYGSEFKVGAGLAWALALMAALRLLRTPLSLVAVSLGRTDLPLKANLWRAAALVPAVSVAALGLPLLFIPLSAVLGELAAALAGLRQARQALADHRLDRPRPGLAPHRPALNQGVTA